MRTHVEGADLRHQGHRDRLHDDRQDHQGHQGHLHAGLQDRQGHLHADRQVHRGHLHVDHQGHQDRHGHRLHGRRDRQVLLLGGRQGHREGRCDVRGDQRDPLCVCGCVYDFGRLERKNEKDDSERWLSTLQYGGANWQPFIDNELDAKQ
ncbi:hypothetical protein BDV40DRAFT_258221 [Aspergillus tamarii]|uniref:Uncharacterized protein n=1 Tax=Aspergillus tamarii TaxID=41984 RepID=A0A5N6V3D6_ASPTM|nr:hypothetical protein BDV40DRAFT_258221 [Aspergillus tamarii]